jgi:hypothetical protein
MDRVIRINFREGRPAYIRTSDPKDADRVFQGYESVELGWWMSDAERDLHAKDKP